MIRPADNHADSRMNSIEHVEGMRFTRNRQNTRSFGKFLAGNPARPLCSPTLKCLRRYSSSLVTSDSVSRSELHVEAFFSKLKFRIFCYS